jgi:hypothetical protein
MKIIPCGGSPQIVSVVPSAVSARPTIWLLLLRPKGLTGVPAERAGIKHRAGGSPYKHVTVVTPLRARRRRS